MFNLDAPNIKQRDLYLWADYAELQCIADPDHLASYADAFDELNYREEGLGGLFAQSDEVLMPESASKDNQLLSQSDQIELNRTDVAQVIENRYSLFREFYPFEVSRKSIIYLKSDLGPLHQIYINQLIAANSRLLHEKSLASEYTTYFEQLSIFLLRLLFPEPFHVKHAGTAPPAGFPGYAGNFGEKMKQIAENIHAGLLLTDAELRTHSGDGGLDGIAWYDFGDNATFLPVILMQAGCTSIERDMLAKSKLISADNWAKKFKHLQALSFMFTPQCYRDGFGGWVMPSELGSILIDRYRIIHLLSRLDSPSASDALNFGITSSPKSMDELLTN
ncbi:MAG: hypothetical protein LBS31_06180 [Candidatus Adiutrix sp.]|jgi:hypothetical protein|nr:hypothetical protein [Candidatus Adiutrix sp.]